MCANIPGTQQQLMLRGLVHQNETKNSSEQFISFQLLI